MLDALTETGRRFVNTWECDENAHMNVQFFFAQFEDAEVHFWVSRGLAADVRPGILTRHVRFHSELRAGDLTVVGSALARDGEGRTVLVHMMHEASSGALAATCYSRLADAPPLAPACELPSEAAPRSAPGDPARRFSRDAVACMGLAPTFRAVVRPAECAAGGVMTVQHHVARFTDGAPHLWEHAGLSKDWLEANGYGRVAVEMKLTIHLPLRAGAAIRVLSGLTGFGAKTISFRHHIVDAATGETAATGEITGLAIDLGTRRSVPWPQDRQDIFRARLIELPR